MEPLTDQELLGRITAFLERTGMKRTRFGREAVGEASLIATLEKGRSVTLKTANKVLDFMSAHERSLDDELVDGDAEAEAA